MPVHRERSRVALVAAGLAAWALAAGVGAAELQARGALGTGWLVAQALFGAGFAVVTRKPLALPTMSLERMALGMQLACALYIAGSSDSRFAGVPLVILAAEAPFHLSRRPAWLLVIGQTAAVGAMWLLLDRPLGALIGLGLYFGLEVFALGAGILAVSEFRARRELLRVHSELLATQALLAESVRHGERVRIARSLHDELGHQLTALSLQLEVASHLTEDQAAGCVATAQRLIRDLLQTVRCVVGELRAERPLALEAAVRTLAAGIPHPTVHLALPEGLSVDHPAQAEALFRCVQELLTNAVQHAEAQNVWIELVQGARGIEARARDDGRGTASIAPGHGLTGMRERLAEVGGGLELESAPGAGFVARAWVPTAAAAG
jgi:signal transduction histidine kinase